jgi:myo-inositol 2-dehydrogenase / D-chiro-inositol 1-dehydrogenase
MESNLNSKSRRKFLGSAATIGAISAVGIPGILTSCTPKKGNPLVLPTFLDKAPDGALIKVGLIGCGGRGTEAALNFLNAAPNLQITALGDMFQDKLDKCRKNLSDSKKVEVDDNKCFLGFDAYKKVIESGVDLVLLATPPYFRPEHFKAAVEARKHVFMEKPVAVDPVGARSVMATAKNAEAVGLCVVTGNQRRHQRDYLEVHARIASGAIGNIVSANCYWNQDRLWYVDPKPGWTEMEAMIRNWVNWLWLSGDHIVEQHVHNIDVINWYTGKWPISAVGFGSRQRRITGDQFDNFSVDFLYKDNVHLHSMCRQINGCINNVSEFVHGTDGYSNCISTIWNSEGKVLFDYEYPKDASGKPTKNVAVSPYDQEHIDLVTAIRTGKPINQGEDIAKSCLTAIMGRISAYTGKEVTWDEMMKSDLQLGPKELALGNVDVDKMVPKPGND